MEGRPGGGGGVRGRGGRGDVREGSDRRKEGGVDGGEGGVEGGKGVGDEVEGNGGSVRGRGIVCSCCNGSFCMTPYTKMVKLMKGNLQVLLSVCSLIIACYRKKLACLSSQCLALVVLIFMLSLFTFQITRSHSPWS